MKTLKYLWLVAVVIGLLAACTAEDLSPFKSSYDSIDHETTVISISAKKMLPIDMNQSRAGLNSILSTVNDLNIRIHLKDNTRKNYFCDNKGISDGNANKSSYYYINNKDLSSINSKEGTQIHFSDIKASQIEKIEIIANYGKPINDIDYSTIKEVASDKLLLKDYCMMYGLATTPTSENSHLQNGPCKVFNVPLKRTRAMISVKINGTDLNPGVEITPKKIRLCNVPISCTLTNLMAGVDNSGTNKIEKVDNPTTDDINVISQSVTQEKVFSGISLAKAKGSNFGGHVDEPNFVPFYMFENMQGTHTYCGNIGNNNSSNSHVLKFPENWESICDSKKRENNYPYSYIEIDADYKYKDNNTVKVSGTITYRFFLGNNATDNFDIEGNHYYKLTLNLKGFGGAKEDGKVDEQGNLVVNNEDLSWRVDMNTRDWGFEKKQLDFDSHYFDGFVNVVGSNWKLSRVIKGDQYASWLLINIKKYKGQDWVNPTSIVSNNCQLNIVDGKLRFNIQPMIYLENGQLDPAGQFDKNSYNQPVNYREMQLEIQNTITQEKDIITIKQYAPIPVTVNGETFFMERFEEYDCDENGDIIYGFPWMYKDNKLNNLKNLYNMSATYHWGNPNKNGVGLNSTYLHNTESAAYKCYLKGLTKDNEQGARADYHALPSQAMMEAMFDKANNYDESWGPFEPMYTHEDYWTSTVKENTPTETIFYNGSTKQYESTKERESRKRIRTVYTVQTWW